jgi:predicted TPR repeat methyltransferase
MKREFSEYYKDKDVCSTYDSQRLKTRYRRGKREKEMSIFLDLLSPMNDKILEVGCSSGFLTQFLGDNVYALDTSPQMIAIARMKNPKARFCCQDMFKLPLFNGRRMKFDKLVSKRVMTHLTDKELLRFFRKVNKSLHDDGMFVFDVEERSFLRRIIRPVYSGIFRIKGYETYQHSLPSITKILNKAGFIVMDARYLNHRVGRQIMIKAVKGKHDIRREDF